MSLRAIIVAMGGQVSIDTWAAAARQEPPVRRRARACAECPLRPGGQLEEGLAAALARASPAQRVTLRRWGCHQDARPCAGMVRLLRGTT